MTLAFVLAFTIPVGYQKYQPAITAVVHNVTSLVQVRAPV